MSCPPCDVECPPAVFTTGTYSIAARATSSSAKIAPQSSMATSSSAAASMAARHSSGVEATPPVSVSEEVASEGAADSSSEPSVEHPTSITPMTDAATKARTTPLRADGSVLAITFCCTQKGPGRSRALSEVQLLLAGDDSGGVNGDPGAEGRRDSSLLHVASLGRRRLQTQDLVERSCDVVNELLF